MIPHGKPKYQDPFLNLDMASEQLWQLTEDAVRNRDLQRLNEVIHKLAEYHGFAFHAGEVIIT